MRQTVDRQSLGLLPKDPIMEICQIININKVDSLSCEEDLKTFNKKVSPFWCTHNRINLAGLRSGFQPTLHSIATTAKLNLAALSQAIVLSIAETAVAASVKIAAVL